MAAKFAVPKSLAFPDAMSWQVVRTVLERAKEMLRNKVQQLAKGLARGKVVSK